FVARECAGTSEPGRTGRDPVRKRSAPEPCANIRRGSGRGAAHTRHIDGFRANSDPEKIRSGRVGYRRTPWSSCSPGTQADYSHCQNETTGDLTPATTNGNRRTQRKR